jgi:hypothetical protein
VVVTTVDVSVEVTVEVEMLGKQVVIEGTMVVTTLLVVEELEEVVIGLTGQVEISIIELGGGV